MPQERTQERIVEETIDIAILQGIEGVVEVVKRLPQERVQSDRVEQIIDVPDSQTQEEPGQARTNVRSCR